MSEKIRTFVQMGSGMVHAINGDGDWVKLEDVKPLLSAAPEAGATWKQVPLGQTSVGAKKARPGHNVTLWHRDCLDESCDYEITITLPPLPQSGSEPKEQS